MEDKEEYVATSSDLHRKLEGVAESLGVSIVRDKAWPKSARWLWRRVKEVLPLLVAAGIEASRKDAEKATKITLRKLPRNDSSNSRGDEDGQAKPDSPGIRHSDDSTSNSRSESDSESNPSKEPLTYADHGITGDTGIKNGDSSEPVDASDEHPWDWLCDECLPV
jgi:hypothetical protein